MQKLLIIPQNWLGDIVMSQTLLKRVKLENPDTKIDILVNSTFKSLVERMPEINKAIILDCGHKELGIFKRLNLAKKIKGSYDQSIVLSRSIISINGTSLRDLSKGEGMDTIDIIGSWQFSLIDRLYSEYESMVETSNNEVGVETVKK